MTRRKPSQVAERVPDLAALESEQISDRFGRCPHDKVECPGCHAEGCPECERCDCEVGS